MPNLTFSTNAEQMTHPLAGLIPQTVFRDAALSGDLGVLNQLIESADSHAQ